MSNEKLAARVATLEADMVAIKQQLEYSQSLAKIERGIAQMHRGEGVPARQVLEKLRKKHQIATR